MSKEQIKEEINRVLDDLPDQSLESILALLKNIKSRQASTLIDSATLDKILTEDKELLSKLAK